MIAICSRKGLITLSLSGLAGKDGQSGQMSRNEIAVTRENHIPRTSFEPEVIQSLTSL